MTSGNFRDFCRKRKRFRLQGVVQAAERVREQWTSVARTGRPDDLRKVSKKNLVALNENKLRILGLAKRPWNERTPLDEIVFFFFLFKWQQLRWHAQELLLVPKRFFC